MSGPFRVRLGGASDADAVLALELAVGPTRSTRETVTMELARSWSRLLVSERSRASVRDDLHLVDEAAADRSAWAPVAFLHYWLVVDEVQIVNVITHPEHRRRGHARALLEALLRDARERAAATASLEVRASNEPAIALYRAFGFESVGVRKRYYDDDEDAVLMSATLAQG